MKRTLFLAVLRFFAAAAFSLCICAQAPIPILQTGHAEFGCDEKAVLTPDGKLLITGGKDGTIKIWEKSGLLVNTIIAHKSDVEALSISEDGKRLLSAGTDGFINLWDVERGSKISSYPANGEAVSNLSFSPNGELFASVGMPGNNQYSSNPRVKFRNLRTGGIIFDLENELVTDVVFSPRADLAAFRDKKSVKVFSLTAGQIKASYPVQGYSDFFSFSPDGRKLIVHAFEYNKSNKLTIRNIDSNSVLSEVDGTDFLAITPDWKITVFKTDEGIVLRNADNGTVINSFPDPVDAEDNKLTVSDLRLAGESLVLIFSDYCNGWKFVTANAKGFGVEVSSQNIGKSATHTTGLAFSKDGKRLAWGSFGLVYLWDVENKLLVNVMKGHSNYVNELAFSPDSNYLVSCGRYEVKLWSGTDGRFIKDLYNSGLSQNNFNSTNAVAFSPDGKLLAVSDITLKPVKKDEFAYESGIKIIDFRSGAVIRRIINPNPPPAQTTGYNLNENMFDAVFAAVSYTGGNKKRGEATSSIRFLSFSPDNKLLASVDEQNYICLWNPASGTLVKTFPKQKGTVHSVDFSYDGKKLVTGGFDDTVKIWDVVTGGLLQSFDAGSQGGTSVKFSLNGQSILAGGYDGAVRIWNSASVGQPSILENHNGKITSLAVHPGGNFFATGGTDGKINFWSLDNKRLIASLIAFPDKEWLILTPNGFYKGSPKADKFVAWRTGNKTLPSNSSSKADFLKPEIITARFKGDFSDQPGTKGVGNLTITQLPAREKRWALIIGVDNYGLKGAVNDAKALKNALIRYAGFPESQIVLLTTDNSSDVPDRKKILTELDILSRSVPPDGLFLFSYSGHGKTIDNNSYLIPADGELIGNRKLLREFWIDVQRVQEAVEVMKVRQVIMILDACRDIIEGRGSKPEPLTPEIIKSFNFAEANKSIQAFVTLYSTQRGEFAYEYFDSGVGEWRGYFSRAIEEGLSGKAANEKGEVTLAGLMKYVEDVVPKRLYRNEGKRQIPWKEAQGYGENDLILAATK